MGCVSLRLATMPRAGLSSGACGVCEPPTRDHASCGSFERGVLGSKSKTMLTVEMYEQNVMLNTYALCFYRGL